MKRIINKTCHVVLLLSVLGLAACSEDMGLDQHGQKVPADRVAGQWVIINYWAQWCAPCREEIPELNHLAKQLVGKPITVLGVNFDALQGSALQAASAEMQIDFTVLAQDPAQRYSIARPAVLPVTYIVDAAGEVRAQLSGEQTAQGLIDQLKALGALPEAP